MPSPFTGPMWPLDPLMMMAMGATQDPQLQDQAAHYLALQYQPPPIPPPRGPAGTTITPPTVPQQTPQMRTPGDAGAGQASSPLPTGDPKATPPSSSAITGSDAGSNQPPPPTSFAGSQPYNFTNYPQAGASVKDTSVASVPGADPGELAGVSGVAASADPTGTSNTGDQVGKVGDALSAFGKGLAGVAPPARQDERQGLAPLPSHESRFTPVDLMTLIQALGQVGGKTAPQSLGALIGR